MTFKYYFISFILICEVCIADGLPGDFMQERDEFFQGSRQTGMGGIGFSRPDDENVMFLNPAGLGIINHRFNGMSIAYGNMFEFTFQKTFFFQDHYIPICFQPSDKNVGGFGIQLESFSMIAQEDIGKTVIWDGKIVPTGDTLNDTHLLNLGIISYGRNLSFWNAENHALGIALMVRNTFEKNMGDPVTEFSLYADIGYTGSFKNGIHLGTIVKKIPIVQAFGHDEPMITLPVSIIQAIGLYRDNIRKSTEKKLSLFTEIHYKISIKKFERYSFKDTGVSFDYSQKHFFSGGFELGLAEFLFIRNGYRLYFSDGFSYNKTEFAFGLGVDNRKNISFNLFYTFFAGNSDWYIDQQDKYNQKRFGCSLSFYNLSRKK